MTFTFDGYVAPAHDVVDVADLDGWRRADRLTAALGQPAVLGVADRAIRLLEQCGDADAVDAAARLRLDLDECWQRDDRQVDDLIERSGDVEAASDHRAACLHLARRATTALLSATGGGGMDLSHPAQRPPAKPTST